MGWFASCWVLLGIPTGTNPVKVMCGLLRQWQNLIIRPTAGVAQLVEQRIRNAKVTSSIPVIGTVDLIKLEIQSRPEKENIAIPLTAWNISRINR